MANQSSLADCAVSALSAVHAMDRNIDNDHPMRHAVRSMKRVAEQILSDAMRQATDLAHQAEMLVSDYEKAKKGSDNV